VRSRLASAEVALTNANSSLEDVKTRENTSVANAYQKLLTTDLRARLTKGDSEGSAFSFNPPTITGSYSGNQEGEYKITLYPSHAQSGYSFQISGLESNLAGTVSTVQPQPLGTKGLFIQFPENFARGTNIEWTVEVPNTSSPQYITLKQAYDQALQNRSLAISDAERRVRDAESLRDQVKAELNLITTTGDQTAAQEALVRQARAALQSAEIRLQKAHLRAPFSGVVNSKIISLGETISPNMPAFSITSEADFHIDLFIPEVDIANLSIGDTAHLKFDAFPEEEFEAEVIYVSPVAEQREGVSSFRTRLELKENDPRIRIGMTANVDIYTETKENVLSVPGRSVIRQEGRTFVRVIENGELREADVRLGLRGEGGRIEILSGLNEGERVITFIRDADLEILKSSSRSSSGNPNHNQNIRESLPAPLSH
jgi:RND family efflux transporter MFP subunit